MFWIILSLTASVFYALRYLIIKKYLHDADTFVMALSSRFLGFLFLLPLLFFFDLKNYHSLLFWKVILATSILTGAASLIQLYAIKKFDVSSSVPYLSFVPFFMVVSVYLIYGEVPEPKTLIGLALLSIGGFIINLKPGTNWKHIVAGFFANTGGLLFLAVAVIFGLTTTLDRSAIETAGSGGFTYTFFWHLASTILFLTMFLKKSRIHFYLGEVKLHLPGFLAQALAGIIAFTLQMIAVEYAKNVAANVIYVKALTLLQILIAVILGIVILHEKNSLRRIAGSVIMLLGALEIILCMS